MKEIAPSECGILYIYYIIISEIICSLLERSTLLGKREQNLSLEDRPLFSEGENILPKCINTQYLSYLNIYINYGICCSTLTESIGERSLALSSNRTDDLINLSDVPGNHVVMKQRSFHPANCRLHRFDIF